jgi:hypothetical protein
MGDLNAEFITNMEAQHKNLENSKPDNVKNEKVCKMAAKKPFVKTISLDRREPGVVHQDKKGGLEGISEFSRCCHPITVSRC